MTQTYKESHANATKKNKFYCIKSQNIFFIERYQKKAKLYTAINA